MNKEQFIERYGEAAWEKKLERDRAWIETHKDEVKANNKKYRKAHKKEDNARSKEYYEKHKEEHKEEERARVKRYNKEHPEVVIANHQEQTRKGGKHYDMYLKKEQTGLRGDRNKIRKKHGNQYRPFKMIIAPESQIHHEWVPNTSEYRGVALVEKEAHMHGFVDVIEILAGRITLRTEEEVKMGGV